MAALILAIVTTVIPQNELVGPIEVDVIECNKTPSLRQVIVRKWHGHVYKGSEIGHDWAQGWERVDLFFTRRLSRRRRLWTSGGGIWYAARRIDHTITAGDPEIMEREYLPVSHRLFQSAPIRPRGE